MRNKKVEDPYDQLSTVAISAYSECTKEKTKSQYLDYWERVEVFINNPEIRSAFNCQEVEKKPLCHPDYKLNKRQLPLTRVK